MPFQTAERVVPPPLWNHEFHEANKRAVHVITKRGEVLRAGRAILFILEQINWSHSILPRVLKRRPFIWATEIGYIIVARNRGFFGRFLFRCQPDEFDKRSKGSS
ncbi:MAG: hypothetical protein MSG64_20100 [Pyrinomonadaceae bacterium MAG19_C2-C3]|nr:hypothetical protein [Pyrinomonadaceae bacterium MAG19_C2-C3]